MESELELDTHTEEPTTSEHAHPLDPISLALGLIFAVVGGVFLFGDIDAANANPAWIVVSFFGAIGLCLVAIGLRRKGN